MSRHIRPHHWSPVGVLVVVLSLSLGACSWIPKGESGLDVGIKDRGLASWYGAQFHGKLAANGELFNMEELTAAHRTLPLGSMVRVTNVLNGKHVRVRINDRGPYVNGRILDLSHAAAAHLDMIDGGISVIQLEVIGDHRPDFVIAAEEAAISASPLLAVHHLEQEPVSPLPEPHLDGVDSSMASVHRLAPTDVLVQRRWKWAPSILSVDPAHRNHPALLHS